MARILAVDWGQRRIGLAVCDPAEILASGLPTRSVLGSEDALRQVAEVATEVEAEGIVVGLPLLLSGEHGEAARAAESFAVRLHEHTGLLVETYDERLTSALSERRLHEGGRRIRDKGQVDMGAAVALLESYLQRRAARARARAEGDA